MVFNELHQHKYRPIRCPAYYIYIPILGIVFHAATSSSHCQRRGFPTWRVGTLGCQKQIQGVSDSFPRSITKNSKLGAPQRLSQIWILINYDGGVSDQLYRIDGRVSGQNKIGNPLSTFYHQQNQHLLHLHTRTKLASESSPFQVAQLGTPFIIHTVYDNLSRPMFLSDSWNMSLFKSWILILHRFIDSCNTHALTFYWK